MVDTIYVEKALSNDSQASKILSRYPKASRVELEHYGEVFNAAKQNFRLQKENPSLILAAKTGKRVIPAPSQYETGGGAHYYFSHMLNCVYDCRYCFLQGMLRSANYLLFVNYQDFLDDIATVAEQHKSDEKPVWFFSGYDCDSLAYEPITRFAETFVPAFKRFENAVLELRTKSTQIRSLLALEPQDNVVVAYSLSPDSVAQSLEFGAPPFKKRVEALKKLQTAGWRIGLRFDPVVWHQHYLEHYQEAVDYVFSELNCDEIDSVTLGGFRLPKGFHKIMKKLHPEHWLFSVGLSEEEGMVVYKQEIESQMLQDIGAMCEKHVADDKVFAYSSYS